MTNQIQNQGRMNRRQFFRRAGAFDIDGDGCGCLVALGLAGAAIGAGIYCSKKRGILVKNSFRYTRHPVDQVFEDHNGYRVNYADANTKVTKIKYFFDDERWMFDEAINPDQSIRSQFRDLQTLLSSCKRGAVIYKDLKETERGYANVFSYTTESRECYHLVEIHIPKTQGLSPGNETYGGKFKTHSQMSEVDGTGIGKK